jgi:DNA-binding NtrC family response regulator
LRVLLVGAREEDFFMIREMLERARKTLPAELDHANSLDEAKVLLRQKEFGLVLFEHETGDVPTLQLLAQSLDTGAPTPFIVLTENADEKAVAQIIAAGAWDCVARSQLDGVNLTRTIRSTLALHSLHQERQAA